MIHREITIPGPTSRLPANTARSPIEVMTEADEIGGHVSSLLSLSSGMRRRKDSPQAQGPSLEVPSGHNDDDGVPKKGVPSTLYAAPGNGRSSEVRITSMNQPFTHHHMRQDLLAFARRVPAESWKPLPQSLPGARTHNASRSTAVLPFSERLLLCIGSNPAHGAEIPCRTLYKI
jgi:hypothetical protein